MTQHDERTQSKRRLGRSLLAGSAMVVTLAAAAGSTAAESMRQAMADQPTIIQKGPLVGITLPKRGSQPAEDIDFESAKPMPLPESTVAPSSLPDALLDARPLGKPGAVAGRAGDGQESPIVLVPPQKLSDIQMDLDGTAPQEFDTSNHQFTTNRANPTGINITNKYPFRAAGKLFFNIGSATYLCSASLIKNGVVVTAAHCVANFGAQQFYPNWRFAPAYNNGTAPTVSGRPRPHGS